MWLLVNHTKPTKILYWQNSGQLQNNTVNGTVSISINRVITKWKHGTSFQYASCKVLVASLRHCDLLVCDSTKCKFANCKIGKTFRLSVKVLNFSHKFLYDWTKHFLIWNKSWFDVSTQKGSVFDLSVYTEATRSYRRPPSCFPELLMKK